MALWAGSSLLMKQKGLSTSFDTISKYLHQAFSGPPDYIIFYYIVLDFCMQVSRLYDHLDHTLYLIITIYFPHLDAISPLWMTPSWF